MRNKEFRILLSALMILAPVVGYAQQGQQTMSNSFPVVIASDQSTISVTGTITPSGTQDVNVKQVNGGTVNTGNGTASGSERVTIASDNTAFTVKTIPNGSYLTATVTGIVALPVGSTTTVLSVATYTSALTVWNTNVASATINVMDASGNYIFGPNYVLPAGQIQGYPLGSGLLFTGVGGSASVTGVKISAGGYQ